MRRFTWFTLGTVLAACYRGERPEGGTGDTARPTVSPSGRPSVRPTDSLVLQAPNGVTVWFTVTRESRDPAGTPCFERALEVRRGTLRGGVPLLYTREAPTLLDSGAMRAVLYNNCRPGPAYRVDFATVSPARLPQ